MVSHPLFPLPEMLFPLVWICIFCPSSLLKSLPEVPSAQSETTPHSVPLTFSNLLYGSPLPDAIVHTHVCCVLPTDVMCAGAHTHVCSYGGQRSESGLPLSLPTLLFETVSFLEPGLPVSPSWVPPGLPLFECWSSELGSPCLSQQTF